MLNIVACSCTQAWCVCAAMILERIVGRDITKPIGKTQFHDVHYLRQMLFCTFKSLHQAQRKLAFHHADLRLANIMELMPEPERSSHSKQSGLTGTTTPKSGRMQDAAVSDMHYETGILHPSDVGATNLQEAVRANQQYSAGQPNLQEDEAVQNQDPVLQHTADAHDLAGYESGGKQLNFKARQSHIAKS